MNKYLYVLRRTDFRLDNFVKDKYTIVYENKSFYYCKVNGSDRLQDFYKENEGIWNWDNHYTVGFSLEEFDINELIRINYDRKNADKKDQAKKKISRLKIQLRMAERELELLQLKENVKNIEQEIKTAKEEL